MYKIGCCLPVKSFAPQLEGDESGKLCSSLEKGCKHALDSGFDYNEISVGTLFELSDSEIAYLQERDLKIEAANSFIPAKFSIIKGGEELERYVADAMRKACALGIKVIVFGSGGARMMPDSATEKEKLASLEGFLRMCDGYAAKYDITVVIEPLNKSECNYINTVTEAAQIARGLQLSNVRSLADAFHMGEECEPFSVLSEAQDMLAHIHVAEKRVRTYPGKENDGTFLPEMAKVLKTTSYTGRISVECSFSDVFSEAPLACNYLNSIFNDE